jgi:hypothetical protein
MTSMGFTVVVYFISLFLVRGIKKEDILLLPKGKKISIALERYKLL